MSDLQTNPPQALDDELARLTDDLLGGRVSTPASPEAERLMRVARDLDALIAPRTRASAESQVRLRRPVEAAWDERAARAAAPKLLRRSLWVLAAVAAAIVLVALVIPPEAAISLPLAGSAAPDGAAGAEVSLRVVILVAGFALLGGWALWSRRPAR